MTLSHLNPLFRTTRRNPMTKRKKNRQSRELKSSTSFVHHPQARSHKAVSQMTTRLVNIQRRRSCDIESGLGSHRQQHVGRNDYKSQAASRLLFDLHVPRRNPSAWVARLRVPLSAGVPRLGAATASAVARVSRLWSVSSGSSRSMLSEGEAGAHRVEHVPCVAIARLWRLFWARALRAGGVAGVARSRV